MTSLRPVALLLVLSAVAALALGAGGYDPDLGAGADVDGAADPRGTASGGGAAGGGGGDGGTLGLPSLGSGLGGGDEAGDRSPSRPLVGAALVAVGGALVLAGLLGGDPDGSAGTDPPVHAGSDPDVAYAGTGPNGVVRAWAELRRRVDDDPARTPGEVAREAVAREEPAEAVETLTDLFETVRYGGEEPTADRERRARAAADRLSGEDGCDG